MKDATTALVRQVVLGLWATLIAWGPAAWVIDTVGYEVSPEALDDFAQALALAVWAVVMAVYYRLTRWVQEQPWAALSAARYVLPIFTGSTRVPGSYVETTATRRGP